MSAFGVEHISKAAPFRAAKIPTPAWKGQAKKTLLNSGVGRKVSYKAKRLRQIAGRTSR